MAAFTRSCQRMCQVCMNNFKPATRSNSNIFSLSKIDRKHYVRLYPVKFVRPDGSSFTINYSEPRRLLKMPVDLTLLTEEEKRIRRLKRIPKKKTVIQEEEEEDFDVSKYKHIWSQSS